jgi:hypothetical protein
MHVLPGLRGKSAQGRLSELRWQFRAAADPPFFETVEKSAVHAARL